MKKKDIKKQSIIGTIRVSNILSFTLGAVAVLVTSTMSVSICNLGIGTLAIISVELFPIIVFLFFLELFMKTLRAQNGNGKTATQINNLFSFLAYSKNTISMLVLLIIALMFVLGRGDSVISLFNNLFT